LALAAFVIAERRAVSERLLRRHQREAGSRLAAPGKGLVAPFSRPSGARIGTAFAVKPGRGLLTPLVRRVPVTAICNLEGATEMTSRTAKAPLAKPAKVTRKPAKSTKTTKTSNRPERDARGLVPGAKVTRVFELVTREGGATTEEIQSAADTKYIRQACDQLAKLFNGAFKFACVREEKTHRWTGRIGLSFDDALTAYLAEAGLAETANPEDEYVGADGSRCVRLSDGQSLRFTGQTFEPIKPKRARKPKAATA
jgi:hypothetical protein